MQCIVTDTIGRY